MRVGLSESEIQKTVFDALRTRAFPGAVYWAVPNNPAARRTAGFLAGVHDVHILHRGKFYSMELKKDGGRPTVEQLEFRDRINEAGGYAFVAEGLEQALAALELQGIIRRAA